MSATVVQSPAPTVENAGVTEISASWSVATTAGNVLLAVFATQDDEANVTTPAGWTKIAGAEQSGRGCVVVFAKTAAGSDAGVTVTYTGPEASALAISELAGLDATQLPSLTDIVVGEDASTTFDDTSATISSFGSTNNGDALMYGFYGRGQAWVPITLPGGFTEEDGDGATNVHIAWGHDLDGGSTSSGDYTFLGTGGSRFAIVLFSWPLAAASAATADLAGVLPAITGSFASDASSELDVSSVLPAVVGAVELNPSAEADLAGVLPAITGAAKLDASADADLAGTLPEISGSFIAAFVATADLAGVLPAITGAVELDASADADLAGTLPVAVAAFEATSTADIEIDGTLPEIVGAFSSDASASADLAGVLAEIYGSIVISADRGGWVNAGARPLGTATSRSRSIDTVTASARTLGTATARAH